MEGHPDTQVFVEVPNDNDLKEFNEEEFVMTNTKWVCIFILIKIWKTNQNKVNFIKLKKKNIYLFFF